MCAVLFIENSGNVGNQDGVSLRRFQVRLREAERAVIFLFMLLLFGRITGQGDRLHPVIRADLDFKRLRFARNKRASRRYAGKDKSEGQKHMERVTHHRPVFADFSGQVNRLEQRLEIKKATRGRLII